MVWNYQNADLAVTSTSIRENNSAARVDDSFRQLSSPHRIYNSVRSSRILTRCSNAFGQFHGWLKALITGVKFRLLHREKVNPRDNVRYRCRSFPRTGSEGICLPCTQGRFYAYAYAYSSVEQSFCPQSENKFWPHRMHERCEYGWTDRDVVQGGFAWAEGNVL